MKRILLTGSNGFIGQNLKKSLPKSSEILELNESFFNKEDWKLTLNSNLLITQPDVIFHVGACSDTLEQNVNYMMIRNFESTKVLTDYCKNNNVPIIYSSSAASYGNDGYNPSNLYGWSKYVAEQYVISNGGIGLRYFNVFGRRQNTRGAYAAVIPLFTKLLIQHESPTINGTGENSRDFTYIDNVVQMNELAMLTDNPEAVNTVYNTAFGERTTLNELVHALKEFLSVYDEKIATIPIVYGENRVGDIPHSLASIDKARRLLNYQPQFSMRAGLKEAVAWYWDNLKGEK